MPLRGSVIWLAFRLSAPLKSKLTLVLAPMAAACMEARAHQLHAAGFQGSRRAFPRCAAPEHRGELCSRVPLSLPRLLAGALRHHAHGLPSRHRQTGRGAAAREGRSDRPGGVARGGAWVGFRDCYARRRVRFSDRCLFWAQQMRWPDLWRAAHTLSSGCPPPSASPSFH
jgi:hypothetical protein